MAKCTPEALQLVKQLSKLPENAICADCKRNASKWASSTLGVFICYECSGIHRALGTHISFVRSCTLDGWTPQQAKLMKRVGNKTANDYWEANLPSDFTRPSPFDRYNMEAFIRAKYAERRWASEGEPPHLQKVTSRFARNPQSPPGSLNPHIHISQSQDINMVPPIILEKETPSAFDFLNTPTQSAPTPAKEKETNLFTSPESTPVQNKVKPKKPVQKSTKQVHSSPVALNGNSDSSFDFINETSQERKPVAIVTGSPAVEKPKKRRGFSRFMKKPTGDQILDQMITGPALFRPVSAPVNPGSRGALSMFDGLDFSKKTNH